MRGARASMSGARNSIDKSMGSSILIVYKSFAENKNVLIIHKVQTSADKKFI
jgi:hypothetical protein